jgi:hypothetical protein
MCVLVAYDNAMTVAPTTQPLCLKYLQARGRDENCRAAANHSYLRIQRARAEQVFYQWLKRQRFSPERVRPGTHSLMRQNRVRAHSLSHNQAVIGGTSVHVSQSTKKLSPNDGPECTPRPSKFGRSQGCRPGSIDGSNGVTVFSDLGSPRLCCREILGHGEPSEETSAGHCGQKTNA